MADVGDRTLDLPPIAVAKEIIVNSDDDTGRQTINNLSLQLLANGPLADRMSLLANNYAGSVALVADLDDDGHEIGDLFRVFGEPSDANKGIYKLTAPNTWVRLGPLPDGDTAGLDLRLDAVEAGKANEGEVVKLNGAQVINDPKTFSTAPAVPDGSFGIPKIAGLNDALVAKQATAEKGTANGYAGLDPNGKVPTAQLPAAVLGNVNYQGTWNATTNTPAIPPAAAGNKGWYYKVGTPGTTPIDGINDWGMGDQILSNGSAWEKIDNTDKVTRVAGKEGDVVLVATDVSDSGATGQDVMKAGTKAVARAALDLVPGKHVVSQATVDQAQLVDTFRRYGSPTEPVDGTALGEGVYVIGEPIQDDEEAYAFVYFSKNANNIRLQARSRSEFDFSKGDEVTVPVVAGAHIIDFDTIAAAGGVDFSGRDYFSVYTPNNVLVRNAGSTVYYSKAGADATTINVLEGAGAFNFEFYLLTRKKTLAKQRLDNAETLASTSIASAQALARTRSSQRIVGNPVVPWGVGTNVNPGDYTMAAPLADGAGMAVQFDARIATVVYPYIVEVRGGRKVKVKDLPPHLTVIGDNEIPYPELDPGQLRYFGMTIYRAGGFSYTVGTAPAGQGFWFANAGTIWRDGEYTDANVRTNVTLQWRVVQTTIEPSREAKALFDAAARTISLNRIGAPLDAAGATSGGYLALLDVVPADGPGDFIEWDAFQACSGRLSFAEITGMDVVEKLVLGDNVDIAQGINKFPLHGLILKKGWSLVLQSATNGFVSNTAATPNPGWIFLLWDALVGYRTSFTATNINTVNRAEVRLVMKAADYGPAHVVNMWDSTIVYTVGPSYWELVYGQPGDGIANALNREIRPIVINRGYSGESLAQLYNRVATSTFGLYNVGRMPREAKPWMLMWAEGENSANNGNPGVAYDAPTYVGWQYKMGPLGKSIATHAVMATETTRAGRVYDNNYQSIVKAAAAKTGVDFLDFVPYLEEVISGAPSTNFLQAVNAERHFGGRSGYAPADCAGEFVRTNYPDCEQAIKVYRLCTGDIDVTAPGFNIDTIVFENQDELLNYFEPLGPAMSRMADASLPQYDRIGIAGTAGGKVLVQSDWELLASGTPVNLGPAPLFQLIVPAEARNVGEFRFYVSDTAASVHVLDMLSGSANPWVSVANINGVVTLAASQIAGKMLGDEIFYRLTKPGLPAITLSHVRFEFLGRRGKPRRKGAPPRATGASLLPTKNFTGFDGTTGAWRSPVLRAADITTTASEMFHRDANGRALKLGNQVVNQPLDLTAITARLATEDVEVEVEFAGENFPLPFDPATMTYPADAAIRADKSRTARVKVELIGPTPNSLVAVEYGLVGLWWRRNDKTRLRFIIPRGTNAQTVQFSSPDKSTVRLGWADVRVV